MSLLSETKSIVEGMGLKVETGVFKETAPDSYAVLTPIVDTFPLHADNQPQTEVQELRISLYDKGNYNQKKNKLVKLLLKAEITITDRRYITHEDSTGYHHYAIDVAKEYIYEMEDI